MKHYKQAKERGSERQSTGQASKVAFDVTAGAKQEEDETL
jgi:hypothetical protein